MNPSPENAQTIVNALAAFGFGSLNLTKEDFALPDQGIQLGVPPVRIDFVPSISEIDWDEAVSGASVAYCDNVPIRTLGREQFIARKRALGRRKDLADLEALGER